MSRRRRVEPGVVWSLSRRTTRRHFLFKPEESRQIDQVFWYCLGLAANHYEMSVHAATLMSTHPHVSLTDHRGQLPLFLHQFHRNLALCTKALRGWPGEVFDKNSTAAHRLLTPRAMVHGLAYVIANPTAAGAVRYARDWPGPIVLPGDLGSRVMQVERPDVYFAPDNPNWPDVVEFPIVLPEALEDEVGEEQARRLVAERLHVLEREAWDRARKRQIPFAGARRVLRRRHTDRARSYEEFGSLNPQFAAAGDPQAAAEEVRRIRLYNKEYDEALKGWTGGNRRVRFPFGTWWMRVHHQARCRPPP